MPAHFRPTLLPCCGPALHMAPVASPALLALTPGRKHLGLTTVEGGSDAIFQKEMTRGILNDV